VSRESTHSCDRESRIVPLEQTVKRPSRVEAKQVKEKGRGQPQGKGYGDVGAMVILVDGLAESQAVVSIRRHDLGAKMYLCEPWAHLVRNKSFETKVPGRRKEKHLSLYAARRYFMQAAK
jgi:hypothetical protein